MLFSAMRIFRSAHWYRVILMGCLLSLSSPALAIDLDEQRKLVNKNVVGVLGDSVRGTDIELIADLATVLDSGYDTRILPIAGKGAVRAIEDLLLLRGVDVALVQADVLDHYQRAELFPDLVDKVRYIAKLYSKELHVLASKDIRTIQDLAGKKVNFGPPSSGSFMTASLVFEALSINVDIGDDDYQIALDKLRQGEIDAWVRVDAKPMLQMENLTGSEDVHLLAVPSSVGDAYTEAALTSEDYPRLIETGERVDTVAVSTIMATYNWPEESRGRRHLESFLHSLIASFDLLQQSPFHPKWREVDLDADIAGWERF